MQVFEFVEACFGHLFGPLSAVFDEVLISCRLPTSFNQLLHASTVTVQVLGSGDGTSHSFADGSSIRSEVHGTYCQSRTSPAEANPRCCVRPKKVLGLQQKFAETAFQNQETSLSTSAQHDKLKATIDSGLSSQVSSIEASKHTHPSVPVVNLAGFTGDPSHYGVIGVSLDISSARKVREFLWQCSQSSIILYEYCILLF